MCIRDSPQPLWLELGCGKGQFMASLASSHPEINFIAIDIKSEVLVLAKRKIEAAYAKCQLPLDNIRILSQDIERIHTLLLPQDQVERIYINFCNPWSQKAKHRKRRLTHPRQLEQYKTFLAPGGEIWFKTDDDSLFADSVHYFEAVSYTHLDVYKRQAKRHGSGRPVRSCWDLVSFSPACSPWSPLSGL